MSMKNFHITVGDPVEELKSTELWKKLNELSTERADNACQFVRHIDSPLRSIRKHFPLYTRHDCHHGYEVLERMVDVMPPTLLTDSDTGLSDDEIFCLIVAAYAHDVGMTVFEDNEEKKQLLKQLNLPGDTKDDNTVLCEYLRSHHAERERRF